MAADMPRACPAPPGPHHELPGALRQRYGRYSIGRGFARAVGKPTIMGLATRFMLPRPVVMNFALRVMGNLSDGRDGDAQDRLFYLLEQVARARS